MCKSVHCYLMLTFLDLDYNRSLGLRKVTVYFYLKHELVKIIVIVTQN
jgi:hypothetical protein